MAGSPNLSGRIEFVILRTGCSPSVALHPVSRRRSYGRLQICNVSLEWTCTTLALYARRRTIPVFSRPTTCIKERNRNHREKDRNPDWARCNEYPSPFSKNTTNASNPASTASGTGFRSFRGLAPAPQHVLFPPRKTGMTRCFWILELNQGIMLLMVRN